MVKKLRILIVCEESQTLCKLFRAAGHEAYSCDLKVCTGGHPEWHIRCDARLAILSDYWDLVIGHPPCTFLTVTANKWLKDQPKRKSGKLVGEARRLAVKEAEDFFLELWDLAKSNSKSVCFENPVGCLNSKFPPSQIIQPYMFGDSEKKLTCLWLHNLPKLVHIKSDDLFSTSTWAEIPEVSFTYKFAGTSINAAAFRSKTFPGIAKAMVEQWTN